ncbi:methyltransferase regulatory domain-containing protein [Rhizobium oryzicola]|uniref:Methyltransferase regulatory domain-containing protein n=1 Tax=Rhizobium oryzicola TaxID=1232668 RepID=A0ABT8SVN8_9HYPH|nr:methyltransferase regulatory domain-containing protein [Rhizobium oryzicola]MDO1582512.1 methyltransferase regulatory domain-containing protein [Rhizobium oryzicola]
MAAWAAGYVSDLDYNFGYFPELNPTHLELALLSRGIKPPKIENACELGFGQGISVNVHCAASSVRWYGNDFNPNQLLFARDLASSYQDGARLTDESFVEFCRRDDLPDFDYICLHGIWSWINEENRGVIVDFLRRKLRVGGVLYISYNTLPGWAQLMPLRYLMASHAQALGSPKGSVYHRLTDALNFATQVLSTNAAFGRTNPTVFDRLNLIHTQDRTYLAHEYFNQNWRPMYFNEVAAQLEPAKLSYAASANLFDHIDPINFSSEQLELLSSIPDIALRETVRDYIINGVFRKDYWVKGTQTLSDVDRIAALAEFHVVATCSWGEAPKKITGPQGEALLDERIYRPILEMLSDFQVQALSQLATKLSDRLNFEQILQALLILAGMGRLHFIRPHNNLKSIKTKTASLNHKLCERAKRGGEIAVLASPLTAGGVPVARFSQLFVLAMQTGKKSADELALFTLDILRASGHALVRDGQILSGREEALVELTTQATTFLRSEFPKLRALQVV